MDRVSLIINVTGGDDLLMMTPLTNQRGQVPEDLAMVYTKVSLFRAFILMIQVSVGRTLGAVKEKYFEVSLLTTVGRIGSDLFEPFLKMILISERR